MGSRVRWGQCFLIDADASRRIVEWARVDGQHVVEVGPGRGALTIFLQERCAALTLVEIDPELVAGLRNRYEREERVKVIEADAVRVDWTSVAPAGFTLVSNLPYESGTAIVASLLAERRVVRELVVMLQKEVVERIAARPGSKTYGGLSVRVQMIADVEKGMVLAPRSFRPRPAVESQMVRIRPLATPRFELGDETELAPVVHASFGQRRKMLRNSLGRWVDARFGDGSFLRVSELAGIAGDVRPEDLSVEQFAALVRAVVAVRGEAARDSTPAVAAPEGADGATTPADAGLTGEGTDVPSTPADAGAAGDDDAGAS